MGNSIKKTIPTRINNSFNEKDNIKIARLPKLERQASPPVKMFKITSSGGTKITHIKKII